MSSRVRSLLVGLFVPAVLAFSFADAAAPAPLDVDGLRPTPLVKVTRITGIGPDGRREVLMSAPEGVSTATDDFAALGPLVVVEGRTQSVVYHTLQAEIAPGVFVRDAGGGVVTLAGGAGVPAVIPLAGAILWRDGRVELLGVWPRAAAPDAPRRRDVGHHHDD
jgi:hypothetical protein